MTKQDEGKQAALAGVKWWNNPYPSGSAAAYEWDRGHTAQRTGEAIKPHDAFGTIRPDEVAECWDGITTTPGLYEALWDCVAKYKAPRPEESEEPCHGMDCVADFWNDFTPEHKVALNAAALINYWN